MRIFYIFILFIFLVPQNIFTDDLSALPVLLANNLKHKTMHAIAVIESGDGKNINHPVLPDKSFAIGKYALMPQTIRHIIKTHKDLSKYKNLLRFNNHQLKKFLKKHPDISDVLAYKYYDYIVQQLGTNHPMYVSYAWLNGPYKAKLKLHQNISAHWHVKKFLLVYSSI